ncbi:MAG: RnfABCDGE type electron transport complex subunit B [Xylophilus ampelinus]
MTIPSDPTSLAERLHALLPQTQCARCGYPDCEAYAHAMAEGTADLNRCPPGGAEGIARLAGALRRPAVALDPACGREGPRMLAVIDEDWCIGCTKCLEACPTDAILGANKRMHTVLEEYCTGCELCLPVCPVDCIAMRNASGTRTGWEAWSIADAATARARYKAHRARWAVPEPDGSPFHPGAGPVPTDHGANRLGGAAATPAAGDANAATDRKRALIEAALARARSRGRS